MQQTFHLPEAWQQAAEAIQAEGGIVMILGASSAGKTTLLKYLVERLNRRNQRVAVVDADIGQSTLGPPATISSVVCEFPLQPIETLVPQEMFFVGSTSPSGYFLEVIAGTKKLVSWAVSLRAFHVLVDTTGFVQGEGASWFKFHKINLLQPRHLLVLQQTAELEPLLRPFTDRKSLQIYRLPVSPMARSRNQKERRAYREKKFRDYFKSASVKLISTRELIFVNRSALGGSLNLAQYRGGFPRYLLVGLNDADYRTLALGIVETFDSQSQEIFIYTPLQDLTPVRSLTLGSLRVDLSGRELGQEQSWEN
jgi:polynucleotide 5'-hydroxyl-kinase GRC3/NOL9